MKRATALLLSPPFLIALSLLAINDALLKSRFPGFVTGKLSDVAGLFAFVVFVCALIPRRRIAIGIVVAVAFTWWKSPLSQPLIDAWNRLGIFAIGRTIDFTDLAALAIIPIALGWIARQERVVRQPRRAVTFAVGALSLLVFTATSRTRTECCSATYEVSMDRTATVAALTHATRELVCDQHYYCSFHFQSDELCEDEKMKAEVDVLLTGNGDRTTIRIFGIRYWCLGDKDRDLAAQRTLERTVIAPLRGRRLPD